MTGFLDKIEACVPALRRYAWALTRNADRADDLVQDCIAQHLAAHQPRKPRNIDDGQGNDGVDQVGGRASR